MTDIEKESVEEMIRQVRNIEKCTLICIMEDTKLQKKYAVYTECLDDEYDEDEGIIAVQAFRTLKSGVPVPDTIDSEEEWEDIGDAINEMWESVYGGEEE
ncbi:MAG: DUF1292 domain-containing protein [Clostridia bacterium]|nr:DUF1292 domain-containing protein [Clostridia bacterium]